jgi:2'-5' RNA ligase
MGDQSELISVKVFFALWPTTIERNQLAEWQEPLKRLCGGRAMRMDTLHNTLVFIGEVGQKRLEALQLAAQKACAECFELCFDKARYWGQNRIVYAAPSQIPPQLSLLVEELCGCLIKHHFKYEQREYKPHVTLLRNAHWTDVALPVMQPVCWKINEFILMQSVQQNQSTNYLPLARFPLMSSSG